MTTKNNTTNTNWVDVTVPLRNGMVVWPGDIKVEIIRRVSMDRGHIWMPRYIL